ncbi:MAG TPA: hypothetical protein VN715_11045 [Roseiarcus sp.]|nr:hypothetical protein [Roseiarcus sp.]
MAKSAKSRKSARPVSLTPALRMTALRVGGAVAIIGVAAGLYAYHGRHAQVAMREPQPVVAAAPAPAVAPRPPAPAPRREASLESHKPMSAALRSAFDSWLMGAYAKCWRAPKKLPDGDPYLAKVRVAFRADGELAQPPKLVNPPSDPAWRPQAEAALKAVKGCDPLHVPDKYAEYYPAWKSRTVYFDPTRN